MAFRAKDSILVEFDIGRLVPGFKNFLWSRWLLYNRGCRNISKKRYIFFLHLKLIGGMLLAFFVDEFTAYKNQKFRFDTNMEKIGFKKCEEK